MQLGHGGRKNRQHKLLRRRIFQHAPQGRIRIKTMLVRKEHCILRLTLAAHQGLTCQHGLLGRGICTQTDRGVLAPIFPQIQRSTQHALKAPFCQPDIGQLQQLHPGLFVRVCRAR